MKIPLPIPNSVLLPNRKTHWAIKSKAARLQRRIAFVIARKYLKPMPDDSTLTIYWYAKTRRHPDPDNALAALKSSIDGIVEAGIFTDDKNLKFNPIVFLVDKQQSRVEIVIEY